MYGVNTGLQYYLFNSFVGLSCVSLYNGVVTAPGSIPDEWVEGVPQNVPDPIERKKSTPTEVRWCSKENCYKPDRAHYCAPLAKNVLRMDHYCPWLCNCVGFYNHKYFWLFLLYTACAGNMVTYSLFKLLFSKNIALYAGHQMLVTQAQGLSFLITTFVTPFFGFHCWLMGKNMTTIEFCETKSRRNISFLRKVDAIKLMWWKYVQLQVIQEHHAMGIPPQLNEER